jgi:hypothetical protein
VSAVAADGFAVVPVGELVPEPASIIPLAMPDREHELDVVRNGFARRTAHQRALALRDVITDARPAAVVCDEMDFGAALVAEEAAVPLAVVLVLAAGTFATPELVTEPLATVRARLDMRAAPPVPHGFAVAPFPPSFRDPARPLPSSAVAIRPSALDRSTDDAPFKMPTDRPFVYATLGTIFNLESGDLFERLLAGLGLLDVTALVTVGRALDPSRFDRVPANIHVERFVPQSLVLAHADVVVAHGGSGTVIGALSHGVPVVLLPMGADQPDNAARCAALGVGLELDAVGATHRRDRGGDPHAARRPDVSPPGAPARRRGRRTRAAVDRRRPARTTRRGLTFESTTGSTFDR